MQSSNKANDRPGLKGIDPGPSHRGDKKSMANRGVRRQARKVERHPDPDAANRPIHGSDWWD